MTKYKLGVLLASWPLHAPALSHGCWTSHMWDNICYNGGKFTQMEYIYKNGIYLKNEISYLKSGTAIFQYVYQFVLVCGRKIPSEFRDLY